MIIDGQVRSGAQASGRRVTEIAPRTNTLRVIMIVVIGLFMACSESFIAFSRIDREANKEI